MGVQLPRILDDAKRAAQAGVPNLTANGDLPPVLVFAHGDGFNVAQVPPADERTLYGLVIPDFLRDQDAHAAALSFTAWVRPQNRISTLDPRSTVREVSDALEKDAAGEREAIVIVGADREGTVLQAKARLKRRGISAPHLGPFEDAPRLDNAVGNPAVLTPLVRALLIGVRAVELDLAA